MLKYLTVRNVKDQLDNQLTLEMCYFGLQLFSEPFNLFKSESSQGIEIWGIIRLQAVNYTSILINSNDDRESAAETPSDEMIMGVVHTQCEFSLLVSQPTHSDLSLKELYSTLKQFCQNERVYQEQKLLKSA